MKKISITNLMRLSMVAAAGAFIIFVLMVPPSLGRYWTVLVFFALLFMLVFCLAMLLVARLFAKRRMILRIGASVVLTCCTVYCLALSSLGQLSLVDLLAVVFVGSFGVWFLLNPKNR